MARRRFFVHEVRNGQAEIAGEDCLAARRVEVPHRREQPAGDGPQVGLAAEGRDPDAPSKVRDERRVLVHQQHPDPSSIPKRPLDGSTEGRARLGRVAGQQEQRGAR